MNDQTKQVAIIVAHPDDETLWAGGTILSHPEWHCYVISLCRKNDADRAPKFRRVLDALHADGDMGDMDDAPDQTPLADGVVEKAILDLLPHKEFDLIVTHSIFGEYTRHRRHEEIGRAVIRLWHKCKVRTKELQAFAYEDRHREYLPVVIGDAPIYYSLPNDLWKRKYEIINRIYGFNETSWEAKSTPKEEAFWQFFTAEQAYKWLNNSKTIS